MIGKRLGQYQIIEKIGEGSMSEVYRARDNRLDRLVALKFLPESFYRDREPMEHRRHIIRAVSELNHPNVCRIYGIEEHEGYVFQAMELLEGETLGDKIRTKPFRLNKLIDIALQISAALEVLHAKGIIHRNIKPAKIFLTQNGEVKLLDFDLAKLFDPAARSKRSDTGDSSTSENELKKGSEIVVGTLPYMSPEQARAEEVDGRSDLFSFGLVLYEMATGKRAYSGNTAAEVLGAILSRAPTPPLRLNPKLPPKLVSIINMAIEKDPNRRYQTARDLCNELQVLKRDLRKSPPAGILPSTRRIFKLARHYCFSIWRRSRTSCPK